MADNLEQVITQAADKLLQAVDTYGPKATELVLETGRIAALQTIIYGIVGILIVAVAIVTAWLCAKRMSVLDKYADARMGYGFCIAVCAFSGVLGFIDCLINLFNVYAWVGLRHPEIYLAAKLLKL